MGLRQPLWSICFLAVTMAPAMKAMKGGGAMTVSGGYSAVAESNELKPKVVRAVITGYMALAASELKKNGSFKIAGLLNMKLKKKPAPQPAKVSIRSPRSHVSSRPNQLARLSGVC